MKCRIDNSNLIELFTLGDIYVSDFIPFEAKSSDYQNKVSLTLCKGAESGLIQLKDTADFNKMYKRYWYHSGTNATMTNELKGIVDSVLSITKLTKTDAWIDIGCNDGTLLKFVPNKLIRVGFDPAENNCKEAYKYADHIVNDYFTKEAYKFPFKAKIITSIAMFYDLPDPNKFCRDIYDILTDDGVWVIQMSYLPLMLNQLAFDNICHEHLEYYSLTVLQKLLTENGFVIRDCQLNDINGGSFRIYIQKSTSDETSFGTSPYRDVCSFRVNSILSYEKELNLHSIDTYVSWFNKILELKEQTVSFIKQEVAKGKSVWAYGASTKGNTLLQFFELDSTLIKGIAERQSQKFGLKTIGTEIPIYSEEHVRSQNPDYMLVLPWHFISEFKEREKEFLDRGGKFIVPCPRFEIIGK